MRGRQQLELTPAEYAEAKRVERRRLLEELLAELRYRRHRKEPWIDWLDKRRRGEHDHQAVREDGSPAACPVPGCDARRGSA